MSDDLTVEPDAVEEFLEHIGVVGMKWGVRRGNQSRTFARASKKAIKLDKKSGKLAKKGAKLQYKGSKWGSFRKIRKGMRLSYKSTKYDEKARKWELKMAQHLQGVKVSDLQPKHKDAGKQYLHMLRGDSFQPTKTMGKK